MTKQTPFYSQTFIDALGFTAQAFRFKRRKGSGVPYLTHLLSVATLVGEGGGDEEQLIAALLHDYLEDIPGGTEAELSQRFSPRVARLVRALSDCTSQPKPPWKERKDTYVAHLKHQPAEVKLISAADKLHNCRSLVRDHRQMGDAIFDRFNPEKEETLWYYRALVPALSHQWAHFLLDELRSEVWLLHELAGHPIS